MRDNMTADASMVDQWMGSDMSLDHQTINLMNPNIMNETFDQGFWKRFSTPNTLNLSHPEGKNPGQMWN